jgi:hypothetical protein
MSKKYSDGIIGSMIGSDKMSGVEALFDKMTPEHEFEFMFFNFNNTLMSYEKYISVMNFLNKRAKAQKLKIITEDTIDVSFTNIEKQTSYRVTINGIDEINKYMKMLHSRKNHVIYNKLIEIYQDKDRRGNITVIKKIKDSDNVEDLLNLNIRTRLAKEQSLTKDELKSLSQLTFNDTEKISFRFKQRVSLYIYEDVKTNEFVRVDLTLTKTTKTINRMDRMVPRYELEIEYGQGSRKSADKEKLGLMFKEIELLLKIIQQSNFITPESTREKALTAYARILSLDITKLTNLEGRQPQSLEIQHVTEILPNRYAVTDKADGDRHVLIIVEGHVYLISTNLAVRDTGIQLSDKLSKYNDSIIDGEYIFLPKENRHLFMAFDCLFNGKEDVRKNPEIMQRLAQADDIIEHCFVLENQVGYNFSKEEKAIDDRNKNVTEFNLKLKLQKYGEMIDTYMKNVNNDIAIAKKFPLIRRKFFIPATGAKPWEIFAYSVLMWIKYTEDKNVQCPYHLDGLMYHPLSQIYTTNAKESKYAEYKWKPPNKNSVDFFIEFERDRVTNKTLTVYDNSRANTGKADTFETIGDDHVKNKSYKICNLYVGKRGKFGEQPVLFKEQEDKYKAYLFLDKGEARDIDGNILLDKSVVEFYYKNDPELDERFRWVPIRTRYDKTESVLRHGKKYGNYIDVADKVWRSIINPILISDIQDLAKGNDEKSRTFLYDKKMESLRSKIGHELIVSSTKENVYFQLVTNLAKPMRQFHNWIKSIIIYTHCHQMYQHDKQLSILDIACGRGADIMKFYYAKAALYVGIDIDNEGLVSMVNGAVSRYNQMRKTHPNFPKSFFIQADCGALLNYDDQERALNGMTNDNRNLLNKFFPKGSETTFDRVNCQFALHYFLRNTESWSNFKSNLNTVLKPGGYFMTTLFDGESVAKLLADKDRHIVYYTDAKGNKKTLFELIKKYGVLDISKPFGVGIPIDVHNAWIFKEGNYMEEYLVDKRFITQQLLDDCDLELVDTDLFGNQFEIHREYFSEYAKYEENPETNKFLGNVASYYNKNDDVNSGCYENTNLIRYYVFRKKDKSTNAPTKTVTVKAKGKQSRVVKKLAAISGGSKNEHRLDLDDKDHFSVGTIEDAKASYYNSIHNILSNQNIIPNTLDSKTFYKDLGIKVLSDDKLSDKKISSLNKTIQIEHQSDNKSKLVVDGLSSIIVEKDCNGFYDISRVGKFSSNEQAVILYKENNMYRPVYRLENEKKTGLFSLSDPLIKTLVDESDD